MQYRGDTEWRKRHLSRLAPEHYRRYAFVFWTHTAEGRQTNWLSQTFHGQFREILLHACARYRLVCPVYCLMPDHAHLVWLGMDESSDQKQATRFLRQNLSPMLHPSEFQKQPHDHVLKEEERERNAFQSVCYYIQENPVRKGLVEDWAGYSYTDCMIPGYPELNIRTEDYWMRFWRVYAYVRKQNEIE
jgi:putative transposase